MMAYSYYKCESHGRFVNVWPATTEERYFYDVVYGDVGAEDDARTVLRVTLEEAAVYVLTELGVWQGATIASLSRMIDGWRSELEAEGKEPLRS